MEGVHSRIDSIAEDLEMRGQGIVLIDSLYELGTLTQSVHAHTFVKDIRADLSKGRFVPVFGGASTTVDDEFPHSMAYLFDGLIELSLWQTPSSPHFQKQVCIPQMQGAMTSPQWIPFEYEPQRGMVLLNPNDEMTPSIPSPISEPSIHRRQELQRP
jgi:archaellum biogenesis ATPase FlaH